MKFTTPFILSAAFIGLVACTDDKAKTANQEVGKTPVNFSTPGTQQSSTSQTGLNPAHGQPGHRCDIPVGASLSTPVKSGTAPTTTTPTPIPTPVTTKAVTPGTNPPHGQPGHDCSIAVGAPLNK